MLLESVTLGTILNSNLNAISRIKKPRQTVTALPAVTGAYKGLSSTRTNPVDSHPLCSAPVLPATPTLVVSRTLGN